MMEENKVAINVSELEKEIKDLVDAFKIYLEYILDNVEDYIKVDQDIGEEEENTKYTL